MRHLGALLVAVLVGGPGCALFGAGDTGTGPCVHDPPLSYENFGEQFITQNCTACHSIYLPEERREGAPLSVNLDTYSDVLEFADRIAARSVGDDATMPPGGGPTTEERARLAEWLSCEVATDAALVSGGPE